MWVSLPRSPLHPYVILPCTFRQRKWAEVSPESVVPHSRATKSMGFVAEESPSSLRHSVLHLWASIMDRSVTQACRAALLGDENVRKCCLSVPRYTLGRRIVWVSLPKSPIHPYVILPCTFRQRKWAEVSPESVVLHPRATKSAGFVAEESPSFLRHSALHPRATKMDGSVTQACRAALSGDKKARKCRLKVSYCTLGRRKCATVLPKRTVFYSWATKSIWVSLPKSPPYSYVILPYTHGQQKRTEVSPERVVPHFRATKKR